LERYATLVGLDDTLQTDNNVRPTDCLMASSCDWHFQCCLVKSQTTTTSDSVVSPLIEDILCLGDQRAERSEKPKASILVLRKGHLQSKLKLHTHGRSYR